MILRDLEGFERIWMVYWPTAPRIRSRWWRLAWNTTPHGLFARRRAVPSEWLGRSSHEAVLADGRFDRC